jgi:hypothetical protein
MLLVLVLTATQACYVFSSRGSNGQAPHPSKRRKTARLPKSEVQYEILPFIPLLRGLETPRCTKVRLDSFEAAWRSKDDLIYVNSLNVRSIEKLDKVYSHRKPFIPPTLIRSKK